jgi:hypothetical protein
MPRFKFYTSRKKLEKLARDAQNYSRIPVYLGATFVAADLSYEQAGLLAERYGARLDEYSSKPLLGWMR